MKIRTEIEFNISSSSLNYTYSMMVKEDVVEYLLSEFKRCKEEGELIKLENKDEITLVDPNYIRAVDIRTYKDIEADIFDLKAAQDLVSSITDKHDEIDRNLRNELFTIIGKLIITLNEKQNNIEEKDNL